MAVLTLEMFIPAKTTFLQHAQENYFNFYTYLNLLYETGLRPNEAYEYERYSFYGDNVSFQPAKGNNTRVFPKILLSEGAIDDIENNRKPFQDARYSSIVRYFNEYFTFSNIMIDNKHIALYVFRHMKFKQLDAEGMSTEDIGEYFGEQDNKNVKGYVQSIINIVEG